MALNAVQGPSAAEGVRDLLAIIADPSVAKVALDKLVEAKAELEKEQKALDKQRVDALATIKEAAVSLTDIDKRKHDLDGRIMVHDASLAQYEIDRRALVDLTAQLQGREARLLIREEGADNRDRALSKIKVELDDREAKAEAREIAAAHSRARMAEVLAEIK